ncbi:MAG: hypothetical protein M3160_02725, partial [Candidatus Eremiobacteraeota bacterium]|nr:hypothetical protein [Candidatus Eremiobacteraeota bacterium]
VTQRDRNDYGRPAFMTLLNSGMQAYYAKKFGEAENDFAAALAIVPDNTLAMAYLNAAADKDSHSLDGLAAQEANALESPPKTYVNYLRLAFTYLAQSMAGQDRSALVQQNLAAASVLAKRKQAVHVGMGILRFNEGSINKAKVEFLAALRDDPNNVLAREYLGQIYQSVLHDPQRALTFVIPIANVVPKYADIQFHIGSLLYDLKEPAQAARYVTNGLELDTGHVSEAGRFGYTLLARIYIQERKLADAKRVLNAAVNSNADAAYARTLLEKLSRGDYDRKPRNN